MKPLPYKTNCDRAEFLQRVKLCRASILAAVASGLIASYDVISLKHLSILVFVFVVFLVAQELLDLVIIRAY